MTLPSGADQPSSSSSQVAESGTTGNEQNEQSNCKKGLPVLFFIRERCLTSISFSLHSFGTGAAAVPKDDSEETHSGEKQRRAANEQSCQGDAAAVCPCRQEQPEAPQEADTKGGVEAGGRGGGHGRRDGRRRRRRRRWK